MCKCLQELAGQHSKNHHQNKRDAEVYTDVSINIGIRPYIFDSKKGTRLARHTIRKSISPKYCPLCGNKVHGYQEALAKGGVVKI